MSVEPFVRYIELRTGVPADAMPPVRGSGSEMAELLWWFLEMFGGEAGSEIDAVPYDPAAEAEADAFLEALAFSPVGSEQSCGSRAARVLKERAVQTIVIALAGETRGETWALPPAELSLQDRQMALILFRLHGMPLYFAPGTSVPRLPPSAFRDRGR